MKRPENLVFKIEAPASETSYRDLNPVWLPLVHDRRQGVLRSGKLQQLTDFDDFRLQYSRDFPVKHKLRASIN